MLLRCQSLCPGSCSTGYFSTYPSGTGTCSVDFGCGQRREWDWPPRSKCCEGRVPGEWSLQAPPLTPEWPHSWRSANIKLDNACSLPSFKGKETKQSCLWWLSVHFSFSCGCRLHCSVLAREIRQLVNYLAQISCKGGKPANLQAWNIKLQ